MQPVQLSSLAQPPDDRSTVFFSRGKLGQLKTTIYQQGLQDGRDAAKAEFDAVLSEHATKISQKLQELAFTHIEARRSVLKALEPVLHQFVTIVLPSIASEALADIVVAHVRTIAADQTDGKLRIHCNTEDQAAINAVFALQRNRKFDLEIVTDPSCAPLEVTLAAPDNTQNINLSLAIESVRQGLVAFYKLTLEEASHG